MMKHLHNFRWAMLCMLLCTATQAVHAQGTAPIAGGRTPSPQSNFFFVRGSFDSFSNDERGLVGSTCPGGVSGVTVLATAANNKDFLIHNNSNKDTGYGNRWTASNVAYGVPTATTYPGGSGNSTMATNFTTNNYYSFRMSYVGSGFAANQVAVHQTAYKPTNFTHVSAVDGKVVGCVDQAPNAAEKLYVRYSTNGGTTYTTLPIVLGAVAGTTANDALCFNVTIPAVSYTFYVTNSTVATAAALDALGNTAADLMSLNDYGTDINGSGAAPNPSFANADCNKMSNFRTRTNFVPVCLPEGGFQDVLLTDNAAVDGCKYKLATEGSFATPANDPSASATTTDFVGESSAYTFFTGTQDGAANGFDYGNNSLWGNPNTGSNADIKDFYISWDPTYLYLYAQGNSANWSNSGNASADLMDMFILIDTDNDVAAPAGGLPSIYATGTNVPAAHLPFNKRVDCNGWKPNYCVAIEAGDNGSDYASLHSVAAGAPLLLSDNDDSNEAACPSFEYCQRTNRTEVRVPWASIGGRPSSTTGAKMNFSLYTTYNDDGYDTYDNAPGLGQGHGKPFEQVGDCPWDGDHWGGHKDPVTGLNDNTSQNNYGETYNADPFDAPVKDQGPGDNQSNSANGRQPGSDRATNPAAGDQADFDTMEEYVSIKNVGQITSTISCAGLPDGGVAVSIGCGDPPAAKVGVIEITADACDVNQNPFSGAYDPYTLTAQTTAMQTAIAASAFVAAGGDLAYISGGGRCAERIEITAAPDVISGKTFVSTCPDPCANKREKVTRSYTITHKNKITNPNATCVAPILLDQVYTCAQVFTRSSANPNCALPINLLYFDADLKGNDVQLTWTTSQEQNAEKFNVLRSIDGENFEVIGVVKASGNSSTNRDYEFTDRNINQNLGRAYYRIQSVDFDGKNQLWAIRTVKFHPDAYSINLIPNPAQDIVNISVAAMVNVNTSLSIYNIMGQEVYAKNFTSDVNNATNFEVNLTGYAKGIYQVVVRSGNNIAAQKLVVK